jgi:hypothetical protein
VKLLEYIATRFTLKHYEGRRFRDTQERGEKFPDVVGKVYLSSDYVYCPSCYFVIGQFRNKFPHITLVANDDK